MAGIHNALAGAFRLGRAVINLTISSNTNSYNIRTAANSAGYVAGMSDITVTVNSGVAVNRGMATGSFTTGDTVRIINNGTIRGLGGSPYGGWYYEGIAGEAGLVGLTLSYPTTITNNGIIGGGGGSGGTGAGDGYNYGGFQGGSGGAGANGTGNDSNSGAAGGPGPFGPAGGAGGAAGVAGSPGGFNNPGGSGGGGGGLGAAGGAGGGSDFFAGGAGGAAGAATSGSGTFATWLVTGTRYGTIG